jgi:hypothetical protein
LLTLSLCACCRHYPGAATGGTASLDSVQWCQPSPPLVAGRPAHRPFRGLLSVHSRYGLHTRRGHQVTPLPEGFRHFVTSMPAPVLPAGAVAGWGLHPLEKRRLITAHQAGGQLTAPVPREAGQYEVNVRTSATAWQLSSKGVEPVGARSFNTDSALQAFLSQSPQPAARQGSSWRSPSPRGLATIPLSQDAAGHFFRDAG